MSDSNTDSTPNSHIVAQAIDKMTMFINMLLSSKEFDSSDDALDLLKNVVDNKQKLKEWESRGVQIKREKNKDIVVADHVAAKSMKREDKQSEKAAAKQAAKAAAKQAEKEAKQAEKEAKQAEKAAAKQAEKAAKQAEKAAAKQAEKAAKQAEKATANGNGNEKKSRGRPKKNMVQVVSQQQENSCIQRLILEEKEKDEDEDEDEEDNNISVELEVDVDDFLEIEHENTTYLVYKGDSNEHFKHGDAFTSDFIENNDPRCGEYDFETERLVLC